MTVRDLRTFLENVVDQDIQVMIYDSEWGEYVKTYDAFVEEKTHPNVDETSPFVGIK